ncbi:hypothetical protein [Nocardia arizonensis]|uniref:hypothetical protein n=1 Tax=Nocardia arizonensis TaxID=1141647 RepID=UPI0006D1B97C|nr:hypothetical protein [Nocardia arizonensis]
MKRISAIGVAAAAVALALSGCGGSEESTDASGLRKGSTEISAGATATTSARPTTGAAASTSAGAAPTTSKAVDRPSGSVSDTTCAEFRTLDSSAEKSVIEQILAENPDSPFAGSPNVALGTAKLVCLASSNADKTVAAAAGIVVGH